MKIKVTKSGDDLDKLSKKLQNPRPFLEATGEAFLERTKQRIRTLKRAPDDTKWAPWASSTAQARRREGSSSSGLLFRTGQLHDNLTYKVQGQKVSIQDKSPYGRYLQNGTSKMPARPYLGVGQWEEKKSGELWRKFLNGKL